LAQLIPQAQKTQFSEPRAGDIYRSLGDPIKARDILGFEPKTSLFDGLRQTVAWMQL